MKTEKMLLGAIGVAVVGILGIVVFSEDDEPKPRETSPDTKILSSVTGGLGGGDRTTEIGQAIRGDAPNGSGNALDLTIGAPGAEAVAWTVPASVHTFREVGYHFRVDPSEAERSLAMLNSGTEIDPDQLVPGSVLQVPATWSGPAVAKRDAASTPGVEPTRQPIANRLRVDPAVDRTNRGPEPWEFLIDPTRDVDDVPLTTGSTPVRYEESEVRGGDYPVVRAPRGEGAATVAGRPVPGQSYTIRDGDKLWNIAKDAYGQGALWKLIYDANRNVLTSPDVLTAGKVLFIPGR